MSRSSTRDALLRQGALLFARHGVADVTTRQLHEAIGARNESALHYHFGGKDGLVEAILRGHLEAVEARRAPLVAAVAADDLTADPRALVHALAAPHGRGPRHRAGPGPPAHRGQAELSLARLPAAVPDRGRAGGARGRAMAARDARTAPPPPSGWSGSPCCGPSSSACSACAPSSSASRLPASRR
ncbi:TetR/AcrR family transcriptional regulator [Nonomuraea ferruginea]